MNKDLVVFRFRQGLEGIPASNQLNASVIWGEGHDVGNFGNLLQVVIAGDTKLLSLCAAQLSVGGLDSQCFAEAELR